MLVQVLMETNDEDTVLATYTYGNDLISMKNEQLATVNYYHYDGLGTVRQLTDATEAVVASYTYDAFGNVIASTGTSENTYGFTGEQQFGEADNLVFLRARYYDSRVGRFISRDPIGYMAGTNLYVYVDSNPVNRRDPSGKWCVSWYGNWCGPGWSGGECSKKGKTKWHVKPIDALDACCKEHDKGYQGYNPEKNVCEKVTSNDRKDANKKLCDCLNKVDPSELAQAGGAGKIAGMKRLFGCNK